MAQTAAQEEGAPEAELIPSTSPLDQSLDKLMGKKKTKSSLVGYAAPENVAPDFRPGTDTISVSGDPATGATTAESWSHDIALENLRRQALETEYTQGQAAQEFAYKQQQAALENARQEAQLGISKAAEARAAQQYGLQAKETQQAMAIKQAAEQREAGKFLTENLGMNPAQLQDMYKTTGEYNRFLAGAPVSRGSYEQFSNYYNSPSYQEQKPTTYFNAVQQMYMPTGNTQPVYQPQKSSQVYNIYGQHVGAW